MRTEVNTKKLTECAAMIALSSVLSLVCIYQAPYGGKVTLGSMVPLVLVCAHIKEFKWGFFACLSYSLVQMLLEFAVPPAATVGSFFAVVLLDYIFAFTVISLVNPILKLLKNQIVGVGIGAAIVLFFRFLCHFMTGILIWEAYAPSGQPVWLYSLIYNSGYMVPEIVITVVMSMAIYSVILKRKK